MKNRPARNRLMTAVAVAIALVSTTLLADGPAAYAEGSGSISGTVTLPVGAPAEWLQGVGVNVNSDDDSGWANVDPITGAYTISNLAPGKYDVQFEAGSYVGSDSTQVTPNLVPQYWNNSLDYGSATKVTVTNNGVTGINASLALGAIITGTVHFPAGVTASDAENPDFGSVSTSGVGPGARTQITSFDPATSVATYQLVGVQPGPTVVLYSAPQPDAGVPLINQYYGGKYSEAESTKVSAVAGETSSGIDFDLSLLGRVSGTATIPAGAIPVGQSINFSAYATIGDQPVSWANGVVDAAGDGSATFDFSFAVPPGIPLTVQVGAQNPTVGWVVYKDVDSVSDGETRALGSFALEQGARVSGVHVMPEGGRVQTVFYRLVDGDWKALGFTGGSGDGCSDTNLSPGFSCDWEMFGYVPAGTYKLAFVPTESSSPMCTRYWDAQTSLATATPFTLASGQSQIFGASIPPCNAGVPTMLAAHSGPLTLPVTVRVGTPISVTLGTGWTPGMSYVYDWFVGGQLKLAGHANSYTPAGDDGGKTVTVVVVGAKSGLVPAVRTLESSAVVGGLLTSSVPKIAGVAAAGNTLTAQPGTWTADATFEYQWFRGAVAIEGATDGTYQVQPDDAGAKISVKVTGSKQDYATKTVQSAAVTPWAVAPMPAIVGTNAVGATLKVSVGAWSPKPTTFGYQWYRSGVAIKSATLATYKLGVADAGKDVTVRVVGSRTGYTAAAVISSPLRIGKEFASAVVTITGVPQLGDVLTASTATWNPSADFTYQWLRGGKPIADATTSQYLVDVPDIGKSLSVRVVATLPEYTTKTVISAARIPWRVAPAPVVTGNPDVGATLKISLGTWSPKPTKFTYQWYRNGTAIKGATLATYKLAVADADKDIIGRVIASRSGYSTLARLSDPVHIRKILTVGKVTISGVPVNGETLTASPGTWTTDAVLSYQWYRGTAPIPGEVTETHVLQAADSGKSVTVHVTGVLDGYSTKTAVSNAVAAWGAIPQPTVSGTIGGGAAKQGATLTAHPGAWSPAPTKLAYQWYRNGAAISGATKVSYKVTTTDAGKQVTVRVTGSRSGYSTRSSISNPIQVAIVLSGNRLVGTGVQPGTYFSIGGSYCYWERVSSFDGDFDSIIANDFAQGQRIVTIEPSDYGFTSDPDCGQWLPIEYAPALTTIPSTGEFLVGQQIASGEWHASNPDGFCYWATLSGFDGDIDSIISNNIVEDGPVDVSISAGVEGFLTSGCGTWTKVG